MGMPMSGAGLVSGSWEGSEEGASGDGEADGSGLKAGDSLTAGDSLAGGWLPVGEGLMAGVEDAAPGAREMCIRDRSNPPVLWIFCGNKRNRHK